MKSFITGFMATMTIFIVTMVIFNTMQLARIESKIDSLSSSLSEASPSTLGTGFIPNQRADSNLSPPRNGFTKSALFEISAYCPKKCCCGRWADGYTASSHKIAKDDKFVAASPDIPFGTLLTIEGYAGGLPVPVLDRGGAIQGNKLDVFFGGENGHQEALNWGRKQVKVKVKR